MSSSSVDPQPSYVGFVSTLQDAALLFEACLRGHLPITRRRLDPSDWTSLISSGHIFVYNQQGCSIQRWTDGRKWSPSRKLDEFLIYRELESAASRQLEKDSKRTETGMIPHREPLETGLYGSLIESYNFKIGGLVKKTITMPVGPSCMRLISYYHAADVLAGRLRTPITDANLSGIRPRGELCVGRDGVGHKNYMVRAERASTLPTMDWNSPGLGLDQHVRYSGNGLLCPSVAPDALWQYQGDFQLGFSFHDDAGAPPSQIG